MTPDSRLPTRAGTYMRRAPGWEDVGWTSVPNALVRDPSVEWDQKGAYGWIASHQQLIFELDAEKLAAAGPRGRNHAYEMLRGLEWHGWLTRSRYRAADGRGTVHIWDLHPQPVAPERRTWKPSKEDRRRGYTAPDGTVVTPELPDGRELRGSPDESAGHPGTPGRSGTPGTPGPGNPTRPNPTRPGFRIEEEKNRGEEQGGGDYVGDLPGAAFPGDAPRPPIVFDLDDPDTWMCRNHRAAGGWAPDEDREPCPACGRTVAYAKDRRAKRDDAERAARDEEAGAAASRAASCRWHDPEGWLLDPDTGAPVEPAVWCTHQDDPRDLVAGRAAAAAEGEGPGGQEVSAGREACLARVAALTPGSARRRPRRPVVPRAPGVDEAARRAFREALAVNSHAPVVAEPTAEPVAAHG